MKNEQPEPDTKTVYHDAPGKDRYVYEIIDGEVYLLEMYSTYHIGKIPPATGEDAILIEEYENANEK